MKLFAAAFFLIASTATAFAPTASRISSMSLRSEATSVAGNKDTSSNNETAGVLSKGTSTKSVSVTATTTSDDDWTPLDFSNRPGVTAPLGLFDPFGLLSASDEEDFGQYRLAELTHGRVAMLATVGYLTTLAGIRLPGCEDVPSGLAGWSQAPDSHMSFVYFSFIFLGILTYPYEEGFEPTFPGDLRKGGLDFGWDRKPKFWQDQKRNIELNNGRAAMMGILGLVVHEQMGTLDLIIPGLKASSIAGGL